MQYFKTEECKLVGLVFITWRVRNWITTVDIQEFKQIIEKSQVLPKPKEVYGNNIALLPFGILVYCH